MSLAELSLDNITLSFPSSPSASSTASSRCGPSSSRSTTDSDTDDEPGRTSSGTSRGSGVGARNAGALPSLRASLQVPPSTTARTAPPGVGGAPSARLGVPQAGPPSSFLVPPPPPAGGSLKPSVGSALRIHPAPGASSVPPSLAPGQARAEMPTSKRRTKVALAPGCSALDWARLKATEDLRGGVTSLLRVTPSELKKHKSPEDCWSAFNNKVYNLTPYLRFHPGGEKELLRVAGRDGTRLFMLTHSWVNIDAILDGTLVGVLVKEPAPEDDD
ncbi:hypothetical protein OC834_003809 [Tilletia horrida]|uniref:Cytochrome b5 heme-binding domain-containing protein n=1 Tax=Tilletia horrida TaxID=155126 RepID=A0AAN6GE85_9BASI|nr:hypothetical protein OC835_004795 [Tilletia horrida]KAK0529135.1 hypothetical protein OC834_003809 [Tilletia horrida]KAK0536710.1 hypothetical protein OC842_001894 [Tilletia horrida]KAK0558856.1 hypothetical protein OC844_004836 [Tilletia horrida]